MVSPVDVPGPPPGSYLPVPTDGRSVVPFSRTRSEDLRSAGAVSETVATPIGAHGTARGSAARGNPLLERGDSFRRPLFTTRPTASFLAQAIAQDTGASGTRPQSAEAARLYRSVQETVDRDVARRTGRPGIDVVT